MKMKGFKETLDEMLELMTKKNHDYTQGSEDPFLNFKLIEYVGVASAEEAIFVRMSDKYSRIATLLKREGKVIDEKLTDTLMDLANYSIIMKCYLESKDEQNKNQTVYQHGK